MNEELNEKLAEWAGWHEEIATMKGGIRYPILLSPDESLIEGYEGYIPNHTPNFTESLDACFKVLVPKLDIVTLDYQKNDCMVWVELGKKRAINHDEDSALALCKAIEKLV